MQKLMTAEELFEWVNGRRGELIKGEFIEMSPSGGTHGKLSSRIARILGNFIEENNLGESFGAETGFILFRDPDTVRAPDFAFISKDRLSLIEEFDKFISIPPDLAVEIISPHDRWPDVEDKISDYFSAGVSLVWIINPKPQAVQVYRSPSQISLLSGADVLQGDDVLPGFSIPVERIFA